MSRTHPSSSPWKRLFVWATAKKIKDSDEWHVHLHGGFIPSEDFLTTTPIVTITEHFNQWSVVVENRYKKDEIK
ncbi:MAG: hypothetical protein P4L79_10235 [Legionella sp.]|uniref:hypothetical protein n=1 Tax=Legionella sp. TaxID=459 RepID=UPI0028488CF9|nr:hypothetical protein [Legionella sp.]